MAVDYAKRTFPASPKSQLRKMLNRESSKSANSFGESISTTLTSVRDTSPTSCQLYQFAEAPQLLRWVHFAPLKGPGDLPHIKVAS